ncbi:phosphomannomutase/phosphoglucomutase [Candidatus Falkowbacteria bacterium]|nr:MAG: phosphomannomutase/phosphoglucomutase [Candidatus Falkowbacteria bacterium]
MIFESSIFKAYDIRGVYGLDYNDDFAYQLGLAYCHLRRTELGRLDLKIVVARDMRVSSEHLQAELIRGLQAGGVTVIDVGLVPTPTFYFSVAHYKYDGGIMVSASHNPKQYNGFKLVRQMASPIGLDSGLSDLSSLMTKENILISEQPGTVVQKDDVIADQVQYDLSFIDKEIIKPFTIIIDTANSMGAVYFDELLKFLPQLTVEKMNWQLDGTFPAHEADPFKPENVADLCSRIKETSADFGIATDGDSDRIFFVDNQGKQIEPGITRAILAKIFLEKKPGATIGYDISPGKITYDTIIKNGGKALVCRVGHTLIKEAMIDTGAYFAGESSGHFFLNMESEGCYEIPGIVALQLMVELSKTGKMLSEYSSPYYIYVNSGEISLPVINGQEKIMTLKEKYQTGKISEFDGLSVEYPDFWFNVRLSNTEPLLRLNIEARSKEVMEKKRDEILSLLQ